MPITDILPDRPTIKRNPSGQCPEDGGNPKYLPKGSNLSIVSRAQLDAIQDSLNGRPRKTLGYLTPSEKIAELLAPTA